MEYKYEMHCHTGNVSLCAKTDAKKLVELYEKQGYSGIVLTDHYSPMTFLRGNIFAPQKSIDLYLDSYNKLKDYCGSGFTVLLGLELRHYATVNDYLIYGVEEDWLRAQKNMLMWNERKMYKKAHEAGYLVFQAHPYRPLIVRCSPEYIDGIEIFNGHTPAKENAKAAQWAAETGKLTVSGSDSHVEFDTARGGIITKTPIKNNGDLLSVLKSRDFKHIETSKMSEAEAERRRKLFASK